MTPAERRRHYFTRGYRTFKWERKLRREVIFVREKELAKVSIIRCEEELPTLNLEG
jgi:hypothetical protein